MSFQNTSEIIDTLEEALRVWDSGNKEKAKLMVVASKHAIQAHALQFAERRFFNGLVPRLSQTQENQPLEVL